MSAIGRCRHASAAVLPRFRLDHAGNRLHREVVAGTRRYGTVLAEALDRAIDDAGIASQTVCVSRNPGAPPRRGGRPPPTRRRFRRASAARRGLRCLESRARRCACRDGCCETRRCHRPVTGRCGGRARPPGGSILITSAPWSAMIMVRCGPGRNCDRSRHAKPSSFMLHSAAGRHAARSTRLAPKPARAALLGVRAKRRSRPSGPPLSVELDRAWRACEARPARMGPCPSMPMRCKYGLSSACARSCTGATGVRREAAHPVLGRVAARAAHREARSAPRVFAQARPNSKRASPDRPGRLPAPATAPARTSPSCT